MRDVFLLVKHCLRNPFFSERRRGGVKRLSFEPLTRVSLLHTSSEVHKPVLLLHTLHSTSVSALYFSLYNTFSVVL